VQFQNSNFEREKLSFMSKEIKEHEKGADTDPPHLFIRGHYGL